MCSNHSIDGISFYAPAFAVEAAPPSSYSGDFLTRSTLTGDWGGARNDLAKKGLTFYLSLTQTGMSVVSGGREQGWEYAGMGNLTIHLNTQKMGLWPAVLQGAG